MKHFIPVILGTAREGRQSEKAARYVFAELQKRPEIETEFVDVREYRLPATDRSKTSEQAKRFSEIIQRADGIVIVSPEYNHGYPGELKMLLDMVYEEYWNKPVGICGVSAGGFGGVRMVEQLKQIATELHLVPVRNSVYFSRIGEAFDEEGNPTREVYGQSLQTMLEELLWYASALKLARQE